MGDKHNLTSRKPRRPLSIFAVIALCSFFYLLGSWQKTGFRIGGHLVLEIAKKTYLNVPTKEEKMVACITPYPKVMNCDEVAGGDMKKFPARLHSIPPRITNKFVPITTELFIEDDKLWKKRISNYKKINRTIETARYRNVMDMNAQLGGFASTLDSTKSWVMNVVPVIADNTLGIFSTSGRILDNDFQSSCITKSNTMNDVSCVLSRCEGFSTYPRTYDLIHAGGLFSLYGDKCKFEDILLEMDRILCPEGAIIVRDEVDVMSEVQKIAI